MALTQFTSITATAVPILGADIDTDRIIPARFLKAITFDSLAGVMFWDERFTPEEKSKNHPLDKPQYKGAEIILSGPNFGCGSSREHAPQTIKRSGIRAIIAESFAEIFFGNSTGIGLPCVSASAEDIALLAEQVKHSPATAITIDLQTLSVHYAKTRFPITIPETAREALTTGRWDAVVELLGNEAQVDALAQSLPYVTQS